MDYMEARKWVNDWLWSSPKRVTSEMPWLDEYKQDVVSMIVDATSNPAMQATEASKEVGPTEAKKAAAPDRQC